MGAYEDAFEDEIQMVKGGIHARARDRGVKRLTKAEALYIMRQAENWTPDRQWVADWGHMPASARKKAISEAVRTYFP